MNYLAVDLAKVGLVGFALFENKKLVRSGYLKEGKNGWAVYVNPKDGSKAKPIVKDVGFRALWMDLTVGHDCFDVVLEDTFAGKSGAVAMKLAEARGFLMGVLYDKPITFHKIAIADWRDTICKAHDLVSWPRDRAAGKELSLRLAKARHRFDALNDDEADAINLGDAFHMQGRAG